MTTMQKVTARLPSWDTTKTTGKKGLAHGKKGFDKVWEWADKLGAPINRLSNRIGSEAFWPMTLDKESDKAARILRSFCKDGFYTEIETASAEGPKKKQRVLKKIPQRVIQNAAGLAIFTTMRTGLWISGAGGSGVLVARQEDGSWSPPSGIMLHTAGLGFLVGIDIYDCVLVINNPKALQAFTKLRATLGGEISAVAGPVGAGGVLENDGKWKQANRPVFTYLKSRGFYAGVQVDGTIVVERTDENARFYGQDKISVTDILAGRVKSVPDGTRVLMETLKAAEGRTDVDEALLDTLEGQPAPGDVDVDAPSNTVFSVPDPDDPDPYGVLALEKEGLEVRDAVTRSRPSSQQFEFHPSPRSPVYSHYYRRSTESAGGGHSSLRPYSTSDASTQTRPVLITALEEPAEPEPEPEPEPEVAPPAYQASGLHVEKDGDGTSSVYEDVAEHGDEKSPYKTPDGHLTEHGDNPWVEAASQDGIAHTNGAAGYPAAVVLPRGPPPPLPPRMAAAVSETTAEFEDVSLKDSKGA